MATTPPDSPDVPQRIERRGCPPGAGTIPGKYGGMIGKPPFVPTDEQRQKVRTLAKTMKAEQPVAKTWIASQMGFSVDTLNRHFADDMVAGRAEIIATLGATLIGIAMGTITNVSKERLDAIKFTLARIGGWSTKLEMSGPGGRPIESVDLSRLSVEQLTEYGRLAAIAEGLDPDEIVGTEIES